MEADSKRCQCLKCKIRQLVYDHFHSTKCLALDETLHALHDNACELLAAIDDPAERVRITAEYCADLAVDVEVRREQGFYPRFESQGEAIPARRVN